MIWKLAIVFEELLKGVSGSGRRKSARKGRKLFLVDSVLEKALDNLQENVMTRTE